MDKEVKETAKPHREGCEFVILIERGYENLKAVI